MNNDHYIINKKVNMNYLEIFFDFIIIKSTALICMCSYACQLDMKYTHTYTLLFVRSILPYILLRKLNAIEKSPNTMMDQENA